jgi:hypothetical protein
MKEETAPKGEESVGERKPDMATKGTIAPIIEDIILTAIPAPITISPKMENALIK